MKLIFIILAIWIFAKIIKYTARYIIRSQQAAAPKNRETSNFFYNKKNNNNSQPKNEKIEEAKFFEIKDDASDK